VLGEAGARRALIVTTVQDFPVVEQVRAAAGEGRVVAVYDEGEAHAPRHCAIDALKMFRDADADSIIAVGGGSAIDVARGVMILDAIGGDFSAIEKVLDLEMSKAPEGFVAESKITASRNSILPLFTVTTTLSQAEFNVIAGITNEDTREKEIFELERAGLMPRCSFLDADVTAYTPDRLWVGSGVKAFETAIIRYLSYADEQFFLDATILHAVRELYRLLPVSHAAPGDLDVRQRLQLSCWQGFGRYTLPIDDSVSVADSLLKFGSAARHQLGGRYRAAHGEIAGVILPAVLAFNLEATRGRQDRLAEALGLSSGEELSAAAVPQFVASLGLPTTLTGLGAGIAASELRAVVDVMASERPSLLDRRGDLVDILTRLM
jgi:alcohol dehydrogenase class IV